MPDKIGRFRILERIGRGGMGMVYKAHDPALDRLVALKVISPDIDITDELKARFFREAQACAKLSHPNIVIVHELNEQEGHFFIVMEFLEGGDLREIIAGRRASNLEEKISLIAEMSDALQYAHDNGVIHRGLKPANILITRDGHAKIADFGIAGVDAAFPRTGLVPGTPHYVAPEQIRGRGDHRSDIFSLGVVCYELLTHRFPFSGGSVMELVDQIRYSDPPHAAHVDPTIPSELSDIVERMLRKNPDHRYQNLEDLRADLDGARERSAGEADHTRGPTRTFAKDVPDQAWRLDSRHFGVGEGREAAEHAREAVARARRSAGRTGSIKLAPDQWMKAAQLEARANAALDRDDFAAAQSLFMEACALYEQCAQFATRGSPEGSMDVGPSRRQPGRPSATPLPGLPSRRQRHGDETVLEPDRPDTEASPRTRDGLGDGPFAFDPTVLAEMSSRGHDDTGSLSTEAESPVAAARSASPRKRRLVATGVGAAGLGILLGVGYVVQGFIRDVRPATPPQARAPYPSALPGPPSPSESTDSSKGETSSLPAAVPSPQPSPPAASEATEPLPPAGQASVEPLVTEPPRELPPRSPELPKRPPEQLAAVPQPLPRPPVIVTPRRDHTPPPAPETVVPLAEPPAPLASLPFGAPLDQTVGWLKKALSTHSKVKTRASQVMYETRGLDGCMIDWRATLPSGRQLTVKAAIHYADGGRTKVTQEDGGWVVSLPWSDGHTVTHGDETFSGFLVWFSSADAAAKAESAFKRAIALCSEEPVAAK